MLDLAQKVFLTAHVKLPEFEGRSRVSTWLFGICQRVASDYRRSAAFRREVATDAAEIELFGTSPDEASSGMESRQTAALAEALLSKLPEEQRVVFVLFELDEMSGQDIAELLDVPVGTDSLAAPPRARDLLARGETALVRPQRAAKGSGMNANPERLLRDAGADPTERELLASVRNVEPPDGTKARAWQGIAGHIAAGVAVGTAAAGTSAATAKAGAASFVTPSLAFKTLAVLVAGGVAAGGYVAWQSASAPAAPSPTTLAPPAAVLEQQSETSRAETGRSDAPLPAVEQASPKRAPDTSRIDPLTAESALLAEARSRLRAGDASGAEELLAKMQSRFPRGVLRQEREVLAIEVLTARGQTEAARERARAFVRAYPKSPHSEKLRRVLDGP